MIINNNYTIFYLFAAIAALKDRIEELQNENKKFKENK